MKQDPEQLVGGGKSGAAPLSLEHGQLLTQSEIFNQQALTGAKQPKKSTNPKQQTPEHGSNSKQNAGLRKSRNLLNSWPHIFLSSDNDKCSDVQPIPESEPHGRGLASPPRRWYRAVKIRKEFRYLVDFATVISREKARRTHQPRTYRNSRTCHANDVHRMFATECGIPVGY